MELIGSLAAGGVGGGVVVWLLRTWIGERLRRAIAHEYNVKLEDHRAQLKAETDAAIEEVRAHSAKDLSVLENAVASVTAGRSSAAERQLDAISSVWEAMVELMRLCPPVLTFLDILTPEEGGSLLTNERLRPLLEAVDAQKFASEMERVSAPAERARPFCGEYVYGCFFIYRAFHGRLMVLLDETKQKREAPRWDEDSGVKQLIGAIATEAQLREQRQRGAGWYTARRAVIESRFLEHSAKVISGELSGVSAFEVGQKLVDAARSSWTPGAEMTHG